MSDLTVMLTLDDFNTSLTEQDIWEAGEAWGSSAVERL